MKNESTSNGGGVADCWCPCAFSDAGSLKVAIGNQSYWSGGSNSDKARFVLYSCNSVAMILTSDTIKAWYALVKNLLF